MLPLERSNFYISNISLIFWLTIQIQCNTNQSKYNTINKELYCNFTGRKCEHCSINLTDVLQNEGNYTSLLVPI